MSAIDVPKIHCGREGCHDPKVLPVGCFGFPTGQHNRGYVLSWNQVLSCIYSDRIGQSKTCG
jgi:hypothetical protein